MLYNAAKLLLFHEMSKFRRIKHSLNIKKAIFREILLPLQLNLAMRFPFCLKNIEYYFVKIR